MRQHVTGVGLPNVAVRKKFTRNYNKKKIKCPDSGFYHVTWIPVVFCDKFLRKLINMYSLYCAWFSIAKNCANQKYKIGKIRKKFENLPDFWLYRITPNRNWKCLHGILLRRVCSWFDKYFSKIQTVDIEILPSNCLPEIFIFLMSFLKS